MFSFKEHFYATQQPKIEFRHFSKVDCCTIISFWHETTKCIFIEKAWLLTKAVFIQGINWKRTTKHFFFKYDSWGDTIACCPFECIPFFYFSSNINEWRKQWATMAERAASKFVWQFILFSRVALHLAFSSSRVFLMQPRAHALFSF